MFSFLIDFLDDLLCLLPWSKRKRERGEEWSGAVEGKRTWTLSRHAYLVVFRTEDGVKKKVRLDRQEDFDSYVEGQRYIKRAGHDLPEPDPAAPQGR